MGMAPAWGRVAWSSPVMMASVCESVIQVTGLAIASTGGAVLGRSNYFGE